MKSTIEQKIQFYIQRLYQYKSLEGVVVLILFFSVYFLLFLIVESFFYLPSSYRIFLFYFAVIISILWILFKILYPLLQSYIPKFQITYIEASKRIGNKNFGIDDKLLNLLQLKEQASGDLLNESIKQLESNLFEFDFIKTLSLKHLFLFIRLLLLPVFLFIILSLINFEGFIYKPSTRIISFNEQFDKPLDFKIDVLNDNLKVVQGDQFNLKFKLISSSDFPVYIFYDDNIYQANMQSNFFTHSFNKVDSTLSFRIGKSIDKSYVYNLKVIYPPRLNSLSLTVIPPKYTGLNSREIANISDVSVPLGSFIKWTISTYNESDVTFSSDGSELSFDKEEGFYILPLVTYKSFDYSISISSKELVDYINLDYKLTTIPDAHPKLNIHNVKSKNRTIGVYNYLFSGNDDYGLTRYGYNILVAGKVIHSKFFKTNSKIIPPIPVNVDTRHLNYSGDAVLQFFISDNDQVNGAKTTYSNFFHLYLLSEEELHIANSNLRDSLVSNYSLELEKQIKVDILNNEFSNLDNTKPNSKNELNEIKKDLERSIQQKQDLIKNIHSISDEELLKEINDALIDQKELLKQVNDALKLQSKDNELQKQSGKLKAKHSFQQKKTLNLLRKIAASQLLKSLAQDAQNLHKDIDKLNSQPSLIQKKSIDKQLNNIKNKLDNFSKLKGSDELNNDVQKELSELIKENSKSSNSDLSRMKIDSKSLSSKLNSKLNSMSGGGESMSIDIDELTYLFNEYLTLSKQQEFLSININSPIYDDNFSQYIVLNNLTFLNKRLYNFALANKYFTRSTFDLIYPLQQYHDKFYLSYEEGNTYKLSQLQREMLTDINSVTDLLSDILEKMQNANPSSSSSSDGNQRQQGTPQDLIEQQKLLNSQLNQQQGEKGSASGNKIESNLSDEQISDIIKKQEEIRNSYNTLNGKSSSEMNDEVKQLKKSLLKHKSINQIHTNNILRMLKDLKGHSKDKINKRKSTTSETLINGNNSIYKPDYKLPIEEQLIRYQLDFNEFYKFKINTKQ